MKSFQTLAVLSRPRQELWTIMRDHLSEFAGSVPEIASVRLLQRDGDPSGVLRVVNEWCSAQQVPPSFRTMLNITEVRWIDRNEWDSRKYICSWQIEPAFLREHIICSGETRLESAMGGRGTRVMFSGELDLKPGFLGAMKELERSISDSIESIVSTVIPRNLRSVAEAAAGFAPRSIVAG